MHVAPFSTPASSPARPWPASLRSALQIEIQLLDEAAGELSKSGRSPWKRNVRRVDGQRQSADSAVNKVFVKSLSVSGLLLKQITRV